ncbi:glycoside hydrolase family 97 protein [Xylanibacter ruminicola]|uniref:glycoside hydrolase family 97 protein n=1 Tax=Xylanibacter ruminicola TaxID=839 RepID=UPI00048A4D0D|nr:glycoside hydrolase family 97 protein [Xylanibacter ruminicola]
MKQFLIILTICLGSLSLSAQQPVSPNGKLTVTNSGQGIIVNYQQQEVLNIPVLGYEGIKSNRLKFKPIGKVTANYQMLAGKKSTCTNEANEYVAKLSGNLQLVLRLYNDGAAFRYELSGLKGKLPKEQTAYMIPEGTKRWMLQWSDSYEGFYPMSTTGKIKPIGRMAGVVKSDEGYNLRWGFPTLVEPQEGVFMLLSEANIERNQAAACLYTEGDLLHVTPDVNEVNLKGKWHSPWRIAIIGSMQDLIQSTLVTDVSEPCKLSDTSWIKPGVVSWIYWAYNHGSNDYNIIKKYVDMAVTLKLPYVLIDAEWDEMKDDKTIEDAVAYANSKGVKPMIWYNSSVGWIDGAPTPKFRLNKPEDREKEFAWCEKIGVAGVKIDFFSGDCQRDMTYCIDLLESAAKHHLLVNFHGATVPRGWQRTYPNLMSTEGVYGAEWYNNVPTFTNVAASHNTTLPFTRNIIGPMDYTPCTFSDSQHPHITSDAHELALTVLYESALQHLADKPESYLVQPQQVQDFFGKLPTTWDETRYVSGYPGESVVLARRSGNTWYVAGINGTDNKKVLDVDLSFISGAKCVQTFADADPTQYQLAGNKDWLITKGNQIPKQIATQPRGGFVLVIKSQK